MASRRGGKRASQAPALTLTLINGFSPVCSCPMAFLNGAVAISLLQARLIELGEPTVLILAGDEW